MATWPRLATRAGRGAMAAGKKKPLTAAKAKTLYDAIDGSGGFYRGHAVMENRSEMNVTFRLPDEDLEKRFVGEAGSAGMSGLKGHRSVGGIRASIYNAFPPAGCERLASFMAEFAARNR